MNTELLPSLIDSSEERGFFNVCHPDMGMDTRRAAMYPFLKDASVFAEENSADIESLISSSTYADARIRGKGRVLDAIEHHIIKSRALINPWDQLMEVLSYPYARMIVSCIDDRFLTKRYALSEASLMNELLTGDRESISTVAAELEVNSSTDADGRISIHFADYLRYSHVMKAVEWKLINTDLRNGFVHLEPEKFNRLLQNALQERIESEIPLNVPPEIREALKADINEVQLKLGEMKNKLSPTGGKDMDPESLPPCIRAILANAQNGINLPHSARFALVTFLNALGLSYDDIIALFSQSPDFDESKSSYQIKHITGELNGGEGYTPPECATMKTNGNCVNPDKLCESDKMNHPLTYYRIKSGNFAPRPPKEE